MEDGVGGVPGENHAEHRPGGFPVGLPRGLRWALPCVCPPHLQGLGDILVPGSSSAKWVVLPRCSPGALGPVPERRSPVHPGAHPGPRCCDPSFTGPGPAPPQEALTQVAPRALGGDKLTAHCVVCSLFSCAVLCTHPHTLAQTHPPSDSHMHLSHTLTGMLTVPHSYPVTHTHAHQPLSHSYSL